MSSFRLATIGIDGMTCTSCSGTVENALKSVKGVNSANVNLTTNTALVDYDNSVTTAKGLVEEIESVGFDAEVLLDEAAKDMTNIEAIMSPIHATALEEGVESSSYYVVLGIEGMTCSSCSGTVENALRSIPGVVASSVIVALTTNTATLQYDRTQVQVAQIMSEVEDVGFGAEMLQDEPFQEPALEKKGSLFERSASGVTTTSGLQKEAGVIKTVLLLIEEAPLGDVSHSTNPMRSSTGHQRLSTEEEHSTHSTRARSNTATSEADATVSESLLTELSHEIEQLNGVLSIELRAKDAQIKVTFDDFVTGPRDFHALCVNKCLVCTVSSLGGFMMANRLLKSQAKEASKLYSQLVLAAALTAPIFCITMILGMIPFFHAFLSYELFPGLAVNGALLFCLSTPVQFYVGHQFHAKALKTLKTGSLGMDFLVSTGTMAAYTYSTAGLIMGIIAGEPNLRDVEYFETSAVLITAVLLGKYLEVYAKGQTAAAIHKLSKLKASSARLVRSGTSGNSFTGSGDGAEDNGVGGVKTVGSVDYGDKELARCGSSDSFLRSEEDAAEQSTSRTTADQTIDAALLHRRDVVRLLAGETVPADGQLLQGRVGVDEAMMTGESALVSKVEHEKVFGGTMVVEGSALLRVTACGDDSTLGRIISTVQSAQASKPPIQELADRVARYFVPVITAVSGLTFAVWVVAYWCGVVPQSWYAQAGSPYLFAFFFALAVWVSACPCAFGLATPTAVLVATGVAAQHGILIRKGAALQYASNVNVVAFDKTGTLTKGSTEVTDFLYCAHPAGSGSSNSVSSNMGGTDDSLYDVFEPLHIPNIATSAAATTASTNDEAQHLLQLMLLAECRSGHPLAKGIAAYCKAQLAAIEGVSSNSRGGTGNGGGYVLPAEEDLLFDVIPGLGIHMHTTTTNTSTTTTSTTHTSVLVGSGKLLRSMNVSISPSAERTASSYRAGGKVAVFMALNGRLRAIVGVSDAVRPEAAHVVRSLHNQGVACYMITGDEATTAHAIAQAVGIPAHRILARAKPDDKKGFIEYLQSSHRDGSHSKLNVAFVGDGTNDSPALAVAQVGFTMASGSDIAVEAGDMVLCKNDLQALLVALDLSAQTMRRIQTNYFWALGYNALLVPVAAGVLFPAYQFALAPMLAGMAMAASSVSIVLSSLLLVRYAPPRLLDETVLAGMGSGGSAKAKSGLQAMEVRHGEGQCDCPASSAYELAPEPTTLLQQVYMYLTCTSGRGSGGSGGGTSADVSTLLSPGEWRRQQEEGEAEEGEFLGRGSVGSVSDAEGGGESSVNENAENGDRRSMFNRLCNPFSTTTSTTTRSRATSNSSNKDYVTYSTLTTDADESDGDVEVGDLELTTLHNKGKSAGGGRLSPVGTSTTTATTAAARGGCGCGQGNCKCGANCRCGEVAKPKLPRVR